MGPRAATAPWRQGRNPAQAVLASSAWLGWVGQHVVVHTGPRSTSSHSRHSTSRRNAAPPEKISVTTPAGGAVSSNSTASRLSIACLSQQSTLRHLKELTRSKRSAVRRRWYRGELASAPSQSNRARPPTSRFSAGRQCTSPTLTTASCRWVETTSRSSLSRATSLRSSIRFLPGGALFLSQLGAALEVRKTADGIEFVPIRQRE